MRRWQLTLTVLAFAVVVTTVLTSTVAVVWVAGTIVALNRANTPEIWYLAIVFVDTEQDGIIPRTWVEVNGTRVENTRFRSVVAQNLTAIASGTPQVKNITPRWLIDYDDDGKAWDEVIHQWVGVNIPDHGNGTSALLFLNLAAFLPFAKWSGSIQEAWLFDQLRSLWYIKIIDYSGLPYGSATAPYPGVLPTVGALVILVPSYLLRRRSRSP